MAASSAFKDVLVAAGVVGVVLGGLFLYTGVWPPMVVVESGSMMHLPCEAPGVPGDCDPGVGYGKLGTIDPGDMVFVKATPARGDIATLAEAAAKDPDQRTYGKPGDVVVYFANNQRSRTPIIHRALAWVEVTGVEDPERCARTDDPGPAATYEVFWEGRSHRFRAADGGIVLPSLGVRGTGGSEGYRPCWSGFITKGDNPTTNTAPDQALGSSGGSLPRQPVKLEWVQGKAVGELPWFGLIKLALGSSVNYDCDRRFNPSDPACEGGRAPRVLNAYAPADLWVMLGVSLAILAIAPLAYDMYVLRRKREAAAGTDATAPPPELAAPAEAPPPGEPPPPPPPAAPPPSPPSAGP